MPEKPLHKNQIPTLQLSDLFSVTANGEAAFLAAQVAGATGVNRLATLADAGGSSAVLRVEPQSPASANVEVQPLTVSNPSTGLVYPKVAPPQVAGPFAVVSIAGKFRWDLVYLDSAGVVAIEAGVEQGPAPVPDFTGAPGFSTPIVAADAIPLAYVRVDEDVVVIILAVDITNFQDLLRTLEKGAVGNLQSDDGTGGGGALGTNWKQVPIDHRHPPNVDAGNPVDVQTSAAPGASDIYARRDHAHQIDSVLLAALAAPRAKSTTCLWMPRSPQAIGGNPNIYHWNLHQFQGRAVNDSLYWFDIYRGVEKSLEFWKANNGGDGALGPNVGPGFADCTNPLMAAMVNSWSYVYLIGNPIAGTVALVYSTNAPTLGPSLLGNIIFADYTKWRVVTCVEHSNDAHSTPVPAHKYDNHVIKTYPTGSGDSGNVAAHLEDLLWQANFVGLVNFAEHVSPLAMAMFVNQWAHLGSRPAPGNQMTLTWGPTAAGPMGNYGDQPPNAHDQFKDFQWSATGTGTNNQVVDEYESFYVNLDATRSLNLMLSMVAPGACSLMMKVVGYIEETDTQIVVRNYNL